MGSITFGKLNPPHLAVQNAADSHIRRTIWVDYLLSLEHQHTAGIGLETPHGQLIAV